MSTQQAESSAGAAAAQGRQAPAVVDLKAHGPHQVERRGGGSAGAGNITRVLWDLGVHLRMEGGWGKELDQERGLSPSLLLQCSWGTAGRTHQHHAQVSPLPGPPAASNQGIGVVSGAV